ncbi:unnamed protein product, partial [Nesidiocoris tenuis]
MGNSIRTRDPPNLGVALSILTNEFQLQSNPRTAPQPLKKPPLQLQNFKNPQYSNFKPNNNFRPNRNWKPNPTPNPQKNQTNQFSRQPQNQGPSSFQNHPKPSFSVQKPIQPPRPASTQAVPMSWRTSNPNFHNMETGQETGNELENPGDNETEDQI